MVRGKEPLTKTAAARHIVEQRSALQSFRKREEIRRTTRSVVPQRLLDMTALNQQLADNLARVRERIDAAARRAGRSSSEITLVAVTKYVDSAVASSLVQAGCLDLGESRPQELWNKVHNCSGDRIQWHLIGHLQRNKVRRTLPSVHLIHSVDNLRLLEDLDRESAAISRRIDVLLEVNISGDAKKHGFQRSEMEKAVESVPQFPHVKVRGFMGMASREGDIESARSEFRQLRLLRDHLRNQSGMTWIGAELSMGMSGDFEAAIEEGATIVRIGSLLFEGILP